MLQNAAESDLSRRRGLRHHPQLPTAPPLSSRAVAVHDVHGRTLRQEKGDDRRAVVSYCPVQSGAVVARPQALEELVQAAPVAAQVAPHCRQVAAARSPGDVVVSARGEIQQKSEPNFLRSSIFYLL